MERRPRESPHPPNHLGDQCNVPWYGGTHPTSGKEVNGRATRTASH
ncbi:hypothetical protein RE6C_05486 [Rhodopirellula europaea 6C]|uniref:Uncharacterized protein n=1 Tax=Rhodopirellula europaea 6C TaxID=1263867 RepID=M2AW98_9BACT|nr:hypothetical protein RE6C_05486 [Rhodopirellula europaea 6C]